MPFDATYHQDEPTREQIEQTEGLLLLEFGADWCGHCQALSPSLQSLLEKYPQLQHLRIADGRGKPLGRSFRVKLWPTLVLLRDGQVEDQLVRPSGQQVQQALQQLLSP